MGVTDTRRAQERHEVLKAIGSALRHFGLLELKGGGLAQPVSRRHILLQAWMPVASQDAGSVLQTKGLPFSLIGPGDMLALFRCLSCKYSFSIDLKHLSVMGAPGRVYTTGEVETSDDVQHCNQTIYLRVKDAQACRVSSTVLLPIFAEEARRKPVAVLEVTQFNGGSTSYRTVFEWAQHHLEAAGVFLPAELETRTFEMQSHAFSLRFLSSRDSALGRIFSCSSSTNLASKACEADQATADTLFKEDRGQSDQVTPQRLHTDKPQVSNPISRSHVSDAPPGRSGDESEDDCGSPDPQPGVPADGDWEPREQTASKALLSREDLDRHFGYGLKEAAQRLGVCKTTLKRACRRYGIARWPRRDLLKVARLKEGAASSDHLSNLLKPNSSQPRKEVTALFQHGSQGPQDSKARTLATSDSAHDLFNLGPASRDMLSKALRCSSDVFPRQSFPPPAFPTRHSLPAHTSQGAVRGIISRDWPTPSLAAKGQMGSQAVKAGAQIADELADARQNSLGGCIDALLDDALLTDAAMLYVKWGDHSSNDTISATPQLGQVTLASDLLPSWQMDVDQGLH